MQATVNETDRGVYVDTGFKKAAWQKILEELNSASAGNSFTKQPCIFTKLSTIFEDFCDLIIIVVIIVSIKCLRYLAHRTHHQTFGANGYNYEASLYKGQGLFEKEMCMGTFQLKSEFSS